MQMSLTDSSFSAEIISRYTTFVSSANGEAAMLFLQQEPEPQGGPSQSQYETHIQNIYQISNCIQQNSLTSLTVSLSFLNRIMASAVREISDIRTRQTLMQGQPTPVQQKQGTGKPAQKAAGALQPSPKGSSQNSQPQPTPRTSVAEPGDPMPRQAQLTDRQVVERAELIHQRMSEAFEAEKREAPGKPKEPEQKPRTSEDAQRSTRTKEPYQQQPGEKKKQQTRPAVSPRGEEALNHPAPAPQRVLLRHQPEQSEMQNPTLPVQAAQPRPQLPLPPKTTPGLAHKEGEESRPQREILPLPMVHKATEKPGQEPRQPESPELPRPLPIPRAPLHYAAIQQPEGPKARIPLEQRKAVAEKAAAPMVANTATQPVPTPAATPGPRRTPGSPIELIQKQEPTLQAPKPDVPARTALERTENPGSEPVRKEDKPIPIPTELRYDKMPMLQRDQGPLKSGIPQGMFPREGVRLTPAALEYAQPPEESFPPGPRGWERQAGPLPPQTPMAVLRPMDRPKPGAPTPARPGEPGRQTEGTHHESREAPAMMVLRQESPKAPQSREDVSDDIQTIRRTRKIIHTQEESQGENVAINTPKSGTVTEKAADVTQVIHALPSTEISKITETIYKAIENRLRTEKNRRGML